MKLRVALVLTALVLSLALSVAAADISGKWTASFETQIGTQNYTYTFKVDGEKLTGTAKSANGESALRDGSVKGTDVKFIEDLDFQGTPIVITYTGKIDGDVIHFTRQVADFATETLDAKRAKD